MRTALLFRLRAVASIAEEMRAISVTVQIVPSPLPERVNGVVLTELSTLFAAD
jgi:hypothetical protein